jgi:hypothetical protein
MAELAPESAEHHLRRQLEVQAETMARRGIGLALIETELLSLERAIRVASFTVNRGLVR